ncbi:MAG TPA: STAS domain-containing protein [Solirubrobacteraceae bacterium]|jgi:anti-anti-sigma factor
MNGAGPKPGSLEISSEVSGDATIVRLQGELDLASASAVEDELAAIEEQRPARVTIDLGGLGFIDSSGLRVLLLADSRAREVGYELVLAPGPEPVQRVFEMTGALDVLHFQS